MIRTGMIDERLIRRGEILISLDFVENYDKELEAMNKHKVGRPYQLTNDYAIFLALIRYMLDMPYRQLEGFTRALNRLIPVLKPVDYSWIREKILSMKIDYRQYIGSSNSNEPFIIALDSTGVKVHKSYGWIEEEERKHGNKKHYIKIHFAINAKTKEIIDMMITYDNEADSKAAVNCATRYGVGYKDKKRGRRDCINIMIALLEFSNQPAKKTHLSQRANLSNQQTTKYLNMLESLGMIKKNEYNYYIITDKGRSFLSLFANDFVQIY